MNIDFDRSALLEQVLAIIRDENTSPRDFRANLRQLGTYLAYESAKKLDCIDINIKTPVSDAVVKQIADDIVVLSLLRAAMPMADAVLDQFKDASLGVISASRADMISDDGTAFQIKGGYTKIPDLNDKVVYVVDPMLATGSSMKYLLELVKEQSPRKIILLVAISSRFGINEIENQFPEIDIYSAAIDEVLNNKGYIVPGLGDAGDRVCNTIN